MGSVYLLQIHTLHRTIHSLHHIRHTPSNLPHGNSRLYPGSHRIDPRRQAQEVQILILLANRILGVDFRYVAVVLLDSLNSTSASVSTPYLLSRYLCPCMLFLRCVCIRSQSYLFQLRLLGLLVFARLCCLSVQLLRCELRRRGLSVSHAPALQRSAESRPTLRLKSAFSSPDMV